jgi:hypothetical protein
LFKKEIISFQCRESISLSSLLKLVTYSLYIFWQRYKIYGIYHAIIWAIKGGDSNMGLEEVPSSADFTECHRIMK